MEGHRQSVVLSTKYTYAVPGADPNAAGNQRKNMMQAVEAGLKRLKTDYVDLYCIGHRTTSSIAHIARVEKACSI
jgi:aryl-alcohol dehydrogenase-like predicted oxidoreductase